MYEFTRFFLLLTLTADICATSRKSVENDFDKTTLNGFALYFVNKCVRKIRVRFPAYPHCKEVFKTKGVFWRPGACVGVGSARQRPLAAHGVRCPVACLNLEIGQLYRHYKAKFSLNVTLNHNQPNVSIVSNGFPLYILSSCQDGWHACHGYNANKCRCIQHIQWFSLYHSQGVQRKQTLADEQTVKKNNNTIAKYPLRVTIRAICLSSSLLEKWHKNILQYHICQVSLFLTPSPPWTFISLRTISGNLPLF